MMEHQADFTFVRYQFDRDELLNDLDDEDHYDLETCVQKYVDLCRDVLEEEYPGAEVQVLPGAAEIQVLRKTLAFQQAYQDAGFRDIVDRDRITVPVSEETPDIDEAEAVEYLCNRIYQERKWVVSRPWRSPQVVHKQFGVPIPIIRWACQEGLIENAKKRTGVGCWEFPLDAFADFNKNDRFTDCEVLCVAITGDDNYTFRCHSKEVLSRNPDFLAKFERIITVPDDPPIPQFHSENSSLLLSRRRNEQITLMFEHFRGEAPWTGTLWSYDAYVQALESHANERESVDCECQYGRAFVESVRFKFTYDSSQRNTLYEFVSQAAGILSEVTQEAEVHLLGGPRWKKIYEEKEAPFCEKVLAPLLRKMGFDPVRETGGPGEFGRDFVFAEQTRFGGLRYYGLQAKAGSIRGGNNSKIDEILGQIGDAFEMSYYEIGFEAKIYISELIIAVSGHFTEDAQRKIREKMPKGFAGSVHFWDREKILSLITKYWSETK